MVNRVKDQLRTNEVRESSMVVLDTNPFGSSDIKGLAGPND